MPWRLSLYLDQILGARPGARLDVTLRIVWGPEAGQGIRDKGGYVRFRVPVFSRWRGQAGNAGGGSQPDVYYETAAEQVDSRVVWAAGANRRELIARWADPNTPRPNEITVRLVIGDGAAYGELSARLYDGEGVAGASSPLFEVPKDDLPLETGGNRIADAWDRAPR